MILRLSHCIQISCCVFMALNGSRETQNINCITRLSNNSHWGSGDALPMLLKPIFHSIPIQSNPIQSIQECIVTWSWWHGHSLGIGLEGSTQKAITRGRTSSRSSSWLFAGEGPVSHCRRWRTAGHRTASLRQHVYGGN